MHFVPDKLIVLEGLDATGKSTTMKTLATFASTMTEEPKPYFTHQPSGMSNMSRKIYKMMEKESNIEPLMRQFLHLACHAEHYADGIIPMMKHRAVFLDRCWWSTIAYGWHHTDVAFEDFEFLSQIPARNVRPDLVFLFMHPWNEDKNNTPQVKKNYEDLAVRFADTTILVPKPPADDITMVPGFITKHCLDRGLLV